MTVTSAVEIRFRDCEHLPTSKSICLPLPNVYCLMIHRDILNIIIIIILGEASRLCYSPSPAHAIRRLRLRRELIFIQMRNMLTGRPSLVVNSTTFDVYSYFTAHEGVVDFHKSRHGSSRLAVGLWQRPAYCTPST